MKYQASGTDWVIVITKPSAEEVAERSLRQAGHRTYLPMMRKFLKGRRIDPLTGRRIRTRREGEVIMRPAIDGYLFVEIWPDQQWRPLLSLPGVRELMRAMDDSRRLALLSNAGIETMRELENDGFYDEPRCRRTKGKLPTRPDLEIGDQVQIELAGIPIAATLEYLGDNDRAVISYMLFGRVVKTETSAKTLELVSA